MSARNAKRRAGCSTAHARGDAPHPTKPNNSDLHTHGERVGVDMPFGPIFSGVIFSHQAVCGPSRGAPWSADPAGAPGPRPKSLFAFSDRKSTRLNSSHSQISYAVFCLKKKKKSITNAPRTTSYLD